MRTTIKENLGCLLPLSLFSVFLAVVIYFGNKKEEPEKKEAIGKYVYIDVNGTLQLRRTCFAIGNEPSDNGSSNWEVERVLVKDLTENDLSKSCARCVTDEEYENMKKILR